jgi:hypothetical protein
VQHAGDDDRTGGPGADGAGAGSPAPTRNHRARRLAWLYAAGATALVPWVTWLALSLPKRSFDHHYKLAWVGFDLLLITAMGRTAYLGFREDARMEIPATATATLLIVDAWFDVTTSATGEAAAVAVLFAVFAELPIAFFSLYVAFRANARLAERAGMPHHVSAGWLAHLVSGRAEPVPRYGAPPPAGSPPSGAGPPGSTP